MESFVKCSCDDFGSRTSMYSVFSSVNFISTANHEEGGYILAHEFGHYFYGVYDEYCYFGHNGVKWTWIDLAAANRTTPCIMNSQWDADGRDYRWLNHSIRYNTISTVYADYECRKQAAGITALGPVYSGPLFDIADPYTVLTHNTLPAGVYRFYFGLDVNSNRVLDENALCYDMAVLNVR